MRLARNSLLVCTVLAFVGSARADLSLGLSAPHSDSTTTSIGSGDAVGDRTLDDVRLSSMAGDLAWRDDRWSQSVLGDAADLMPGLPVDAAMLATPDAPVLREIRPLPSSAAMFFTAMLSLGALQVFRHPPSLKLSALPSWYHSGGPAQVGHVTPLDLDFHSLTLCIFDPANRGVVDCTVVYGAAADQVNRLLPQVVLSPAAPRGPPLAA